MEIKINTNDDDRHAEVKKELRAVAKYLTDEIVLKHTASTKPERSEDIRESFDEVMKAFHSLENALTGETKPFKPGGGNDSGE